MLINLNKFKRVVLTLSVTVLAACGPEAAPVDPDAETMARGVEMLYRSADPIGAEALFREVLVRTPTHYGAHYQLAVALDSGGKPAEARPAWEAVLRLAAAISDSSVTRTAQQRLAAPDTAAHSAMMTLGLHLLYARNDAAAAAEQFRALLRRNSTHYGASYQLATALDRAGQVAEARAQWVKVLGMATAIRDTATANTARARLR